MTRRNFALLMLTGALATQAAEIPRPSADYRLNLPGGRQAKISDYKGKVLVVEFLLVTCPHCQSCARVMSKLQTEYGSRGVQMLGISIEPSADVSGFVQTTGANFPVGTAPTRDSVYGYLQHSVMSSQFYVPQLVIIDRDGVIREQHGGTDPYLLNEEQNLRRSIEAVLTLQPTGAKKTNTGPRARKKTS